MTIGNGQSTSNRVLASNSGRSNASGSGARGAGPGSASARVAATITKSTPRTGTSGRSAGGRPSSAQQQQQQRQFNYDPPSVQRTGAAALGYGKRHRVSRHWRGTGRRGWNNS